MTVTDDRPATVLGSRMLRREDPALLTGEAKYTNDLHLPGALHLALARSPYAHARILSVDLSAALSAPRKRNNTKRTHIVTASHDTYKSIYAIAVEPYWCNICISFFPAKQNVHCFLSCCCFLNQAG